MTQEPANYSFGFLTFTIGADVAIRLIPTISITILAGIGNIPKNIKKAAVNANKIPNPNNIVNNLFCFI